MTAKKADGAEEYNASEIQVLEGLEPVRKRPGMYIGSTGYDGLHHCLKEIADNSIDEAIAGYATQVRVTLLADGGCRVDDDGRGIPVDIQRCYTLVVSSAAVAIRCRLVCTVWVRQL